MNSTGSNAPQFSRRSLILIVAGLLTGLLLGALDQTIVATAAPRIIVDLNGLTLYAWVFSAYILTQTVSMPIFGKLSDLYGRRKFLMLGLLIFMGGSALSGAAQDINQLIIFRAIQGIGSGAFFPIAIAVAGAVFPPAQRGRIQGVFASVFGMSAVLGPTAGSYIVQTLSWRWIFYVNLPLGVLSIAFLALALKESRDSTAKPVVDWLGVTSLTAWITFFMLGFLSGGTSFGWYSWQEVALFGSAIFFFALFMIVERRALEPIVPLGLFKIRTISAATSVAFLTGVSMYAVISYVPLFVQAGLGGTIDDGRNVLYAFMIPLVIGAVFAGQLSTRSAGYRQVLSVGLVVLCAGLFLLTSINSSSSFTQVMEDGAVMGLGLGTTFPVVILAVQYSVPRRQIGIASSLAQFTRNLGGTIGLSILGALQANAFGARLTTVIQQIPSQYQHQAAAFFGDPNAVGRVLASSTELQKAETAFPQVPWATIVPELRSAFALSVTPIFWVSLGFAVVAVVAGVLVKGSFREQVAARDAIMAGEARPEMKPPPIPITEQSPGAQKQAQRPT
ncbi:MAG: MFS transporter [archaeon]|nr:MAG: MFS transporter [archaeon]